MTNTRISMIIARAHPHVLGSDAKMLDVLSIELRFIIKRQGFII